MITLCNMYDEKYTFMFVVKLNATPENDSTIASSRV